jgi:hypothetical protein
MLTLLWSIATAMLCSTGCPNGVAYRSPATLPRRVRSDASTRGGLTPPLAGVGGCDGTAKWV